MEPANLGRFWEGDVVWFEGGLFIRVPCRTVLVCSSMQQSHKSKSACFDYSGKPDCYNGMDGKADVQRISVYDVWRHLSQPPKFRMASIHE